MPPRRSSRPKPGQKSITSFFKAAVKVEDIPGGEGSSPAPSKPLKRSRRVIIDSDDELEEEVAMQAPAAGSSKRSCPSYAKLNAERAEGDAVDEESYAKLNAKMAEGDAVDEESYAKLNAKMAEGDAVDELSQAELDAEMAEGDAADWEDFDDEYYPGPDDEDENDLKDDAEAHPEVDSEDDLEASPQTSPDLEGDETVNQAFAEKLRSVLDQLTDWAKAQDPNVFRSLHPMERAVSLSMWALLTRVSVDLLMEQFLPAIPIDVQNLFVKKTWTLKDFLSLRKIEGKEKRQGLYGNFPTGDLLFHHRQKFGCEAYAGSTKCLRHRVSGHRHIARHYTVSKLLKKHRRSFLYKQICRPGVQCNFRLLAAFKKSIQPGYLVLLEGIMMLFLGSYNHPGYVYTYSTALSYELVSKIRESLDLPDIPWKGLNAAWSLCQGFSAGFRSESKCCNPPCNAMTYPGKAAPRYLINKEDPLGGYICAPCAQYRRVHGTLRDAAFFAQLAVKVKARMENDSDAECYSCKDRESALPLEKDRSGERTLRRKHQTHQLFPGKLFCMACILTIKEKGRIKTSAEAARVRGMRQKKRAKDPSLYSS